MLNLRSSFFFLFVFLLILRIGTSRKLFGTYIVRSVNFSLSLENYFGFSVLFWFSQRTCCLRKRGNLALSICVNRMKAPATMSKANKHMFNIQKEQNLWEKNKRKINKKQKQERYEHKNKIAYFLVLSTNKTRTFHPCFFFVSNGKRNCIWSLNSFPK